jgi:hypothetical protein
MSRQQHARAIVVAIMLCATVIVASGCASSGPTAPPPASEQVPPAASPTAAPDSTNPPSPGPVSEASDIRFASSTPDIARWSPPVLDVYAPAGARDLPLVVMFPPHSLTKDDTTAFAQLATEVAGLGAVVVVANWSQLDDPPAEFEDPVVLEAIARQGQSAAGCAVSFAVAHSSEYGADPSRLVLLGELYGGNVASMVALGSPDPLPGCGAEADWAVTGLVAWDADWMALMPAWDGLGKDSARAVAALSPWPLFGDAPKIPVDLVVSDGAVIATQHCDGRDATRVVERDPTGAMRDRLDEIGALADGCADLGEAAEATAVAMQATGVPATVSRLGNPDGQTQMAPGGNATSLGPADLELLSEIIDRAAHPAPRG